MTKDPWLLSKWLYDCLIAESWVSGCKILEKKHFKNVESKAKIQKEKVLMNIELQYQKFRFCVKKKWMKKNWMKKNWKFKSKSNKEIKWLHK